MFGVFLNNSNMIASDGRLAFCVLVNRLTCPSLECMNAAVPSAGAGETGDIKNIAILQSVNVKKYLHIRQLSFSGLAGFVDAFFPFFYDYFLLSTAKFPRAIFCHFCSHFFLFLSVVLEIS